ncbi:POU domain, class 4, transcription factor 3 [Myiozetetes cayanensis]|uniref:POU domain, class 4, transcription factor 3 n=1 Tax=Myiozetetes cayanensis TaxID=478635 RepID=UPI00215E3861|nr:POU domain, class 4, transcription factor 3 [Myiozetetes cayanensis]
MMSMDAKQPFAVPAALQEPKFPSLHAGADAMRRVCLPAPQLQGNIFGSFDESLLARAEALAAADIAPHAKGHHLHAPFKPDAAFHAMSGVPCAAAALPHPAALAAHPHPLPHPALDGGDLLEHLSPSLAVAGLAEPSALPAPLPPPPPLPAAAAGPLPVPVGAPGGPAPAADPRELEAFAERFKQRRVRLGVTQADVGAALAALKLPGVGSLSQSTICRFESLTLSHNNMTALRPVLQAWLEGAEAARRARPAGPDPPPGAERKRRRTSIAAPERRSLEAYFALQPRPSAEKIAAIAEKLDLKKNVVRVWFCNQRQKQKRMKYSAVH